MNKEVTTYKTGKILYILLIILGFIGVVDTVVLSFYTNINVGILAPGLAGIVFIIYGYLKLNIFINRPIIKYRPFRLFLKFGILAFLISFILVEALIISNSSSQDNIKVDYLIILGGGINGETVSLSLRERLDKGIEYLKNSPDTKVIVSGGRGVGEDISEAEAMRRYLTEKAISPSRIIMEDKSTSTMENFMYSKKVLETYTKGEYSKIMVITSDYHMFRSKMLANRNGLDVYGITCSTPSSVWINSYVREYFAFIKSYIFDR